MSCPSSCARRRGGASSSARPETTLGVTTGTRSWPSGSPIPGAEEVALELDAERIVARTQGREGWLREGRRQVEQHRWEDPDPIPRARAGRLLLAVERLDSDLDVERRANQAYQAYRARGRMKDGRRFGGPPNPYTPPDLPVER